MDVIRTIPEIKRLLPKPDRFDFDKYLKYKNNSKFQEQYKDLNNGIHPFTKRQFDKNNKCFYNTLMKNITTFPYEYYDMLYQTTPNIELYIEETRRLNKQWKHENDNIKKYNNTIILELREKQQLLKWNEFIIHNNKKYGCPHIIKINNECIHKTNDCNGLMILHEHIKCTCNACLIFIYGCGNTGSDTYKCTKCDIIHFV